VSYTSKPKYTFHYTRRITRRHFVIFQTSVQIFSWQLAPSPSNHILWYSPRKTSAVWERGCPLRKCGVFLGMRTFKFFCCKKVLIFRKLWCVCTSAWTRRRRELKQCGHFTDKGEGSIFCGRILWTAAFQITLRLLQTKKFRMQNK